MAERKATGARVAVAVTILTVHEGTLQVLLLRRGAPPFDGWWALPGGLLPAGVTLDEFAAGKLAGETGVREVFLEQLYTFTEPPEPTAPPAATVAYFALVEHGVATLRAGEWPTRWWPVADHPPLAFTNDEVVRVAVARLRGKLEYTNAAYSLLPEKFTFAQLQRTYEAILGRPLDKRNFYRRILSLGLIEPLDEHLKVGAHRPAALFRFRRRQAEFLSPR